MKRSSAHLGAATPALVCTSPPNYRLVTLVPVRWFAPTRARPARHFHPHGLSSVTKRIFQAKRPETIADRPHVLPHGIVATSGDQQNGAATLAAPRTRPCRATRIALASPIWTWRSGLVLPWTRVRRARPPLIRAKARARLVERFAALHGQATASAVRLSCGHQRDHDFIVQTSHCPVLSEVRVVHPRPLMILAGLAGGLC
jgi:hypothetical protein